MIPIAGVLLLIIIVFSVAIVVSNPEIFDLSIFGASIPVTTAGVYFTGAGAMLVLILAAALLRRGVQREMKRRRQVRALQNAAGVKSLPTSKPKQRGAKRSTGDEPEPAVKGQATAISTTAATGSTQAGAHRPSAVAPSGDDRQSAHSRPLVHSPGEPDSPSDAHPTTLAERQALLDEAEELTGDSPER